MSTHAEQWSYLGPEGTFTEQAALDLATRATRAGRAGARGHAEAVTPALVPAVSVSAALADVRAGRSDAAIVPLENSVEGAVPLTQDELTHGEALVITAEAYVPITFQLLGRRSGAGSPSAAGPPDMTKIQAVGSHPHGLAQVRDYLAEHLPHAKTVVTDSTAAAAAAVADGTLDAAAAAPVAGRRYGLSVLADDIGLTDAAITRFVLLRKATEPPAPTGNDRTSMVLWVVNEPGTLLGLLNEFSLRGINLTRLESRPTRTTFGEYVFLIDADGHVTDPAIADVLAALTRRGALLRYLGSYPREHGASVPPADFASNESYRASMDVVDGLRHGRLPDTDDIVRDPPAAP